MKKYFITLFIIIVMYSSSYAQKKSTYVNLKLGTSISPEFMQSGAFSVEYGKTYSTGLSLGIQLALFNSVPYKTLYSNIDVINYQTDKETAVSTMTQYYSGKKDVSVFFNVGYDVLSLIPQNYRHHFTPYFGYGVSNTSVIEYFDNRFSEDRKLHLRYDQIVGANFTMGAKYEYDVTDKLSLGLYFSHYELLEHSVISIGFSRCF